MMAVLCLLVSGFKDEPKINSFRGTSTIEVLKAPPSSMSVSPVIVP